MPRMRDGRRLGGRYGAADHAEQYRPYRGASRLPKHPRKHGKPIGELHGGCIFPSWGGNSSLRGALFSSKADKGLAWELLCGDGGSRRSRPTETEARAD